MNCPKTAFVTACGRLMPRYMLEPKRTLRLTWYTGVNAAERASFSASTTLVKGATPCAKAAVAACCPRCSA